MLGGGGLVAANVYASATEGDPGSGVSAQQSGDAESGRTTGAATIDCPDVGAELTEVPQGARAEVDKDLALLDQQIADAYGQLRDPARAAQGDSGAVGSEIIDPLKEERAATIERIAAAIDRVGERPEGLDTLAACELRPTGDQVDAANGDAADGDQANGDQSEDANGGQDEADNSQDGAGNAEGGQEQPQGNGPVAADYADIKTAPVTGQSPAPGADASRGTFVTDCGVNENGLFNSDNVIVAPGVTNGAHHFHDYVGNQANNAFADDQELANGDTSCQDQGDKSSYYWPVVRLQNGTQEQDADAPGGGIEGNVGEIVTPKAVTLTFVGNPRSKVTAMPRLLRVITGDAKAFVNGTANANASWSCTGFEDRQLKDKYPLCPQGSDVVRTFKFQSCWDGRNADSANHRTHVAFAQADGSCPEGFKAIPQLVQRIVYDVDAPSLKDGGRTTPLFAVDSFPEQLHKPVTDHGDFINIFDESLMRDMVDCINDGRRCGAGANEGGGDGSGNEEPEQPQEQPKPTPDAPGGGNDGEKPGGDEKPGGSGSADKPTVAPATSAPAPAKPDDGAPTAPDADEPKADATPTPAQGAAETSPEAWTRDQADGPADEAGSPSATAAAAESPAGSQTEPQATGGGLADTGTQLWPAAAGAVLLISGFVLLRRTRRGSQ
ncbi:DUF1996 domain-containing protein [Streptomyces sp. SA15]|uniref:DUF1996 domain-containing protein n=1 Tax=Streptomyces sp. SA15 TaxID=934019 RepID=UPI00211CDDC8|nr:DUF1996 domain-containing protein [Streptomyces sp. SA15]